MADSSHFYGKLRELKSFEETLEVGKAQEIPDDWFVVATDIVDSTRAIEAGRYKDVNAVGASVIVSLLNIDRTIPIPFTFGGDGTLCAVPPSFEHPAREALLYTQQLAYDGFGLQLRACLFPATHLKALGLSLRVAKHRLSPNLTLATFSGGGWEHAERMTKNEGHDFNVKSSAELLPHADYSGLECRWRNIPCKHDHKLSLIVASTMPTSAQSALLYKEVIEKMHDIFKDDDAHPVSPQLLQLSANLLDLRQEAMVRTYGRNGRLGAWAYRLKALCLCLTGKLAMAWDLRLKSRKWGSYKSEVAGNSDTIKFDGALKMVVDVKDAQLELLEGYLRGKMEGEQLIYGLHVSRFAIMTCLVFSHTDNHIHFIDGGEGGYALAAQSLKQRLIERRGQAIPQRLRR